MTDRPTDLPENADDFDWEGWYLDSIAVGQELLAGRDARIASLEAELADANNGKRLFRAEWQAAETQRDRYRTALERIAHPEGPDDLDQVQTIALAALRETA